MQHIYPHPTPQLLEGMGFERVTSTATYRFNAPGAVAANDEAMRQHIRRVCEYRLRFYSFSKNQEEGLYRRYAEAVAIWSNPSSAARLMEAYGAVYSFSLDLNVYASVDQAKNAISAFQDAVMALMTEQGRRLDAPVFDFVRQADGKNITKKAFWKWNKLLKILEMKSKDASWKEVAAVVAPSSDEYTGKCNAASKGKRQCEAMIRQTEEGLFPQYPVVEATVSDTVAPIPVDVCSVTPCFVPQKP